jgi:type IV pilus assembly protein PilM
MASGQAVWGIDVGKCALKAVRLRAGAEDKVELLATDYIAHPKILTQPDANRDELVASALEKFLSRNDISTDKVVVSVPGQHTLARFSKLPPLEEKKIPDIVRYEADQQIPFDIDEVIWDYQTFREEDSPEIEVGIFAMKRELIRSYLMHFENAGIEPVMVQSSPLALYNTAAYDGLLDDGATTVILDIGAENTDLIVATPWSLWTRTIPLGGNNFTEALVKSFKLSFSKAESLKLTASSSKYARQIFQAMRPIFADLVQELQRSIGFYTSTHRDAKLTKCLGLGSAFQLPGLAKYLQQNLSLTMQRPSKFNMIEPSSAVNAPQFSENLLSFGVAYGLALQGLGLTTVSSNLLPPEIAKQAVWRRKRPFFGAAAACLLLGAGAMWMRYVTDVRALEANQGGDVRSMDVDGAADIIDGDMPGTVAAGEYARTIERAAEVLRRERDRLARMGAEERETIEQIVTLQNNKSVMPRLYQLVHAALPQVQEPLASATSPQAFRQAIQDNPQALKRGAREQIFIEEFIPTYYADAYDETLEDQSGEPPDEITVSSEMNTEGFIVTLKCRTPNREEIKFVSETFMKRLRELGRQPGMGFCINRVVLPRGERMSEDEEASSAAPSRGRGRGEGATGRRPGGRGAGRGMGRGATGGAAPPPADSSGLGSAEFIDPLTDEPMDRDWVFTIEFDVYLSDAPEPEEDEEADEADEVEG